MKYFRTLEATVVEIERLVLACDNKKFLMPLTIYVKILPSLANGLEAVGFFNTIQISETETYVMFIDVHDGMICGITQNFYDVFGINPKFVYGFAQNGTEMNID